VERRIPESDWKIFRKLHEVALERFCERVLTEVGRAAESRGKTAHERYLANFKLLKRRDAQLADAFNDMSRSKMLLHLARIQAHKLLTDEEFARFSPETREAVRGLLEIWRE